MTKFRRGLLEKMKGVYPEPRTKAEAMIVEQYERLCEDYDDNNWNNDMLVLLLEAHQKYPCR